MATTIATLAAKLSLDNKAFLAGFKQSISASKGFAASLSSGLSAAGASMAAGVAGALSLATAVYKVQESMERVDRGAKLAERLGLSNEAMQRMAIIAKSGNVDVETLSKAMLTMGRNIGTGGKTLDERFFDVADSIAAIKDPAERSKRAIEIFGKEGSELLNTLMQGNRMRQAAEVFDQFGLAISRTDAAKVEKANDALARMGIILDGLTDKLATGIAPAIENWANNSIRLIDQLNKSLGALGVTANGIGATFDALLGNPLMRFALDKLGIGSNGGSQTPKAATPLDLNKLTSPDKTFKPIMPAALERGSMEAVRAMQSAGRSTDIAQKQLLALEAIRDFVDPMKRPDAPRLVAGAL